MLPNLHGGGAERVSIDLAHSFKTLGHDVEIVLMNAEGIFLLEAQNSFSVIDLSAKKARYVPITLSRYLRTRKPDVLIAQMWPLTSAAVIGRTLSRQKTKLLLVEHSMLRNHYASWGKFHNLMMRISLTVTYRFADYVAAVSEGAAKDLAKLARLNSKRVVVLQNPIPIRKKPSNESIRVAEELWNYSRGYRILTVGNLTDPKNHPLLLRAFSQLARPDSHLMILGQGQNEDMLRELANGLGISERVVFAGFHPDPTPFYATADMFVLSSDYEGLPTVLIEALSFGLPIVSTNCPSGPAEILENGKYGRLVAVGDADALAKAMDEMLEATVDREALIRRAADFSPEIAARKYLELLGLK